MVNKPYLRERGWKETRKKKSHLTCFYYHPYLIPEKFAQDNSRGDIGIEKMVPKEHAKYFKR
jgi:hypothetical protein